MKTRLQTVILVSGGLLGLTMLVFGWTVAPGPTVGQATAGITVPAGATITFTSATLSACNALTYGYELDGGADVPLGSKAAGCGSGPAAGGTIGPFGTTRSLRVFLTDVSCGFTFYSDGNHALVTPLSSTSWLVDITDGGGSCESPPGTPRTPTAGNGNLDVTIIITLPTPTPTSTATVTPTATVEPARVRTNVGGAVGPVGAAAAGQAQENRARAAATAVRPAAAVVPPSTGTGITPPSTGDGGLRGGSSTALIPTLFVTLGLGLAVSLRWLALNR